MPRRHDEDATSGGGCALLNIMGFMGALLVRVANATRRTRGAGDRGSAEARGPIDTYKGVSVCVVLWLEKNGKKRGVLAGGAGCRWWTTEAYAEGVRSNVCATGTSPHVSLF